MTLSRFKELIRRRTNPFLLIVIAGLIFAGHLLTLYGPLLLDQALLYWFRDSNNVLQMVGPSWLHVVWRSLTWMGDTLPRIITALIVISLFIVKNRTKDAYWLAATLLSGFALSSAIKYGINRPRPELLLHLEQVNNASFPSGHAMNSTLFYGALLLLIGCHLRSPILRWGWIVLMLTLVMLTGISRIALGVHYPSDVLAGWLIGSLWLAFCLAWRREYSGKQSSDYF